MGSPHATSSSSSTRHSVGNLPSYPARQMEASFTFCSSNIFRQTELVARNYPPMQSAVEPSEDSINTLVSMGFDRNNARQALVQARNDVNVATNILLEAQSH
ncbi:hypothetical protein V8G54_019689 [Vigna mungo]|uniref:UBA domain-containing protein n=1 Tax=Vigna mungo TaxID=3915 RepID=A0AAQ3ND10_VIGMU